MPTPSVTVAIVTARDDHETSYDKWRDVRREVFLRKRQEPMLHGELGALLAAALREGCDNHVKYQLRALGAGTHQPDAIRVVDRRETDIREEYVDDRMMLWCPPQLSPKELEANPQARFPWSHKRATNICFGCSDKNTAIGFCATDVLVMLDDCCLPSFGLVETVREWYSHEGNQKTVFLVGHRQLYLPGSSHGLPDRVTAADANWSDSLEVMTVEEAQHRRRVFGIWAMPLEHIFAVNGFNPDLDGQRGGLDEELLCRMDRYATAEGLRYVQHPAVRVYELEHEMPWKPKVEEDRDWCPLCPEGWVAPGPDLRRRF